MTVHRCSQLLINRVATNISPISELFLLTVELDPTFGMLSNSFAFFSLVNNLPYCINYRKISTCSQFRGNSIKAAR